MNEGGTPRPAFEAGTEWLRGEGDAADVVMSSRARLARNLSGFPFVAKANRDQKRQIMDVCKARIMSLAGANGLGSGVRVMWVDLHDSPPIERTLLVERHLISQQHARGKQTSGAGSPEDPRGVAVCLPEERLSIMVNEEDQLRLQAIRSGLALTEAWSAVSELDDRMEAGDGGLTFAFSPRFGYLTACPTNVGTGARMSVMLHLPGLRLTGNIDKVKRAAADMSLAVRGFYGEGSEHAGDFYQLSNQTTLGKAETALLEALQARIVPQVVEYERAARKVLLTKRRGQLEDQVFRSLGILSNARLLTAEESMQHLSCVRLGVVMGLIENIDQRTVNQLMLLTQPAHLQRVLGKEMDQDERRSARARMVREKLGRA